MFVKNTLTVVRNKLNVPPVTATVSVTIKEKTNNIEIFSWYRQWRVRQGQPQTATQVWESIIDQGKQLTVIGDINIDTILWDKKPSQLSHHKATLTPPKHHLDESVLSRGMSLLRPGMSWTHHNRIQEELDIIMMRNPSKISQVCVLNDSGSDHNPVSAMLSFKEPPVCPQYQGFISN